MRILKYRLEPDKATITGWGAARHVLNLPPGPRRIVHVHTQDGVPTMWAECPDEDDATVLPYVFYVVPTGISIPDHIRPAYIGTVHVDWLVWHIYEGTR